jgi:hypothetical protein
MKNIRYFIGEVFNYVGIGLIVIGKHLIYFSYGIKKH